MPFNNLVQFSKRERERNTRMVYRDRMDIFRRILQVANGGGAARTKLMYRAFLSYSQTKDYLMVLTQNDLISYDLDTQMFKTTQKGLRFIEVYSQMADMIKARRRPPLSQQQALMYEYKSATRRGLTVEYQ
jgi:predicted transcriptional regulator